MHPMDLGPYGICTNPMHLCSLYAKDKDYGPKSKGCLHYFKLV